MDITPRIPEKAWLTGFFSPGLNSCRSYHIDEIKVTCKLDQNESPHDWPAPLKEKVLSRLMETPWNRYPAPYCQQLHQLLSQYAGTKEDNILAGPGSHHLLCLLLSLFSGGMRGKLVVARPSFPLYEQHCRAHNIPWEPWELDENLNYDLKKLPAMPAGSVLLFASPNNPVGNVLSCQDLEALLKNHPDSMIIADEAYYEFASQPYTPLLQNYSNLILVRTLSKAMATAGLRVGYAIAAAPIISSLKKMLLPYLLNHFSMIAAAELLQDADSIKRMRKTVEFVNQEKVRITREIARHKDSGIRIIPSEANFLLLKWPDQQLCQAFYRKMIERNVLVRDVSAGPGLKACLRVTVGTSEENNQFLSCFP